MRKAVLISIQPKWCELIASGKKTVEVRKSRPKIDTPFKCYIYCTKNHSNDDSDYNSSYSGKVIGEFICDEVRLFYVDRKMDNLTLIEMATRSCLSISQLEDYSYQLFGWNISNLVLYDNPKDLSKFTGLDSKYNYTRINHPPQSWRYVEEIDVSSEFYSDAVDLQDTYHAFLSNNLLTKAAMCKICTPFKDKYHLTEGQILRIARKEVELSEMVLLAESISAKSKIKLGIRSDK